MTTNLQSRIHRVRVKHIPDTDPDTSWLGEYSSQPGEHAIDRQERGHARRGEFRYFNPANHHNVDDWENVTDKGVLVAYEETIETGFNELSRDTMCEALNAHYREQDYQRMEGLNAGQWHFIGIQAFAEIVSTQNIVQEIHSGGLWGIESDSDADYLRSVEQGQLTELKQEMASLGFDEETIAESFRAQGEVATEDEGKASAARIVACVNALAGLNPEVVKAVAESIERLIGMMKRAGYGEDSVGFARVALARLKGQP